MMEMVIPTVEMTFPILEMVFSIVGVEMVGMVEKVFLTELFQMVFRSARE